MNSESDTARPAAGRRARSWLKIALVLSLAINLALLGFVAGRSGGPGWQRPAVDPVRGFAPFLRDLPEARRDALRPLLRDKLRGRRGQLREFRRAHRDVRQALAAEPFDAGRLSAALAAQRGLLAEHHRQSHQAFVALVSELSASERSLLLARLAESGRGHDEHGPPPTRPPTPPR